MGDDITAIGVFWDIENCHVPRFVSALSVVQRLRTRFFSGHREAEFMCVCDINKESKGVIEDLNNGQVDNIFPFLNLFVFFILSFLLSQVVLFFSTLLLFESLISFLFGHS